MSAVSTVTRTVRQYTCVLPEEVMEFLRGIAADYSKVKCCIYQRYSGIRSLAGLSSVYSILNEMRYCGLREQLNLPSVYYELAIADAVKDIKSHWWIVKDKINSLAEKNENLSRNDRIYIRTVLKIDNVYAAILNHQQYKMPENASGLDIDTAHLNRLLCRLTRRYLTVPKPENTSYFRVSPNGYSYKDGGIRIVCRTPRKRVFLPLKDGRIFDRQILIQIRENDAVLVIPVQAKVQRHSDYTNTVYIHIGNRDMFTLSNGNTYGALLEELVNPETERLARKNQDRGRMYQAYGKSLEEGNRKKAERIEVNNLGKTKYNRQKEKERAKTQTYINMEINRMIAAEKPERIVIVKPVTRNRTKYRSKQLNRKLTRSFNGYIRERLAYKCQVHSIELTQINSSGTGSICSCCGASGERKEGEFICKSCGFKSTIPLNSAKNIEKKYKEDRG